MKKLNIIIIPLLAVAAVISGCEKKDPLDHEQYIKQVYIVGANNSNNGGLSIVNLPYSQTTDQEQVTNISVATSGSQNIDRDITATLADAGTAPIARYNFLYLYKDGDIRYQKLDPNFYSIPNKTVKVNSGETYGTTALRVKTANLNPDSLYAITVKIAAISDPSYISVRKTDTVLMVSFALTNAYSGICQVQGKYYKLGTSGPGDTVSLSLTRTMKALDYNTVRFYHLSNTEVVTNAAAYGVKVKVNADNSLTITPYGTLALTAGSGTYDAKSGTFTITYNYTVSGVVYQFKGTFKRNITS
jgi:hypothetical protein